VVSAELVVPAASVARVVRRNYQLAATAGNIIPRIAAEHPTGIVERQTDLAVRLGETRCLIVKPAQGSRLADRAAICLAIVLEAAAWAIEGEELAEAIEG
jgi:hypothetical protein